MLYYSVAIPFEVRKMRIFLSGGSGFVGRHLLRRLHAEGHEVVASVRSSQAAEAVKREGATPWHGTLVDRPLVAQALRDCHAVLTPTEN